MTSGTKVTFSSLISLSGCGMGVFGDVVLVSLMSTKKSWYLCKSYIMRASSKLNSTVTILVYSHAYGSCYTDP